MAPHPALGDFELAVLVALVALDEPYGAAIRREVSSRLGRECAVGAVYVTLQRLEDKGLVSSHMTDPLPIRGGRSRRSYRLTKDGERALLAARAVRDRLWQGVPVKARPA